MLALQAHTLRWATHGDRHGCVHSERQSMLSLPGRALARTSPSRMVRLTPRRICAPVSATVASRSRTSSSTSPAAAEACLALQRVCLLLLYLRGRRAVCCLLRSPLSQSVPAGLDC